MRLPRRIDEIIRRKESFLESARNKIEKSTIRLQGTLLNDAVSQLIPQLDVKDGIIQDTANNYRLVSEIENIYSSFNNKVASTLLPQINSSIEQIVKLNQTAFQLTLAELPARFEKVIENTRKLIDLKVGLKDGKLIRGGFLKSVLVSDPTEFKQFLSRAITGQIPVQEFISGIKEKIIGNTTKRGLTDRQFNRFVYDLYHQYDAAYNTKVAEEFGMKYFVYSGNLIDDSRDFCAAHKDKVFHIDETKEWPSWTPAKGQDRGEFPDGWEVKAKDIYKVPSYIDYPGYDPLTDRGGFNCRHQIMFISDELAKKKRGEK
ncbi:MAG: hypothetical protein ABFC18_03145 [Rikenellaceae bacterium]